jgi:hypothetical protein
VGADKMKTDVKIKKLEDDLKLAQAEMKILEAIGNKNDKAIAEINVSLGWVKDALTDIKNMLGEKRGSTK